MGSPAPVAPYRPFGMVDPAAPVNAVQDAVSNISNEYVMAVRLAEQFYQPKVNSPAMRYQDTSATLPPIFGDNYKTYAAEIESGNNGIAQTVLDLYHRSPNGKVSVQDLYAAIRCKMIKSNAADRDSTDMTPEALADMFGGETVTLEQALDAATHFRNLLAFRSEEFQFESYRQATEFVSKPDSFANRQFNPNDPFAPLFAELRDGQALPLVQANYVRQGFSEAVARRKAESEAKRCALDSLWFRLIKHCHDNKISLVGINFSDPEAAQIIEKHLLAIHQNKLNSDQLKTDIQAIRAKAKQRAAAMDGLSRRAVLTPAF